HLLEKHQPPEQRAGLFPELHGIHLRRQIVMIEQEPLSERSPQEPDQPVRLRRVARVNDVEPRTANRDSHALHERPHKAPEKFGDETQRATSIDRYRVPVDVHVLETLIRPREALRLRTDDGYVITGAPKRRRLQPHSPVERHRKVLDDDENSTATSRGHDIRAYLQ